MDQQQKCKYCAIKKCINEYKIKRDGNRCVVCNTCNLKVYNKKNRKKLRYERLKKKKSLILSFV